MNRFNKNKQRPTLDTLGGFKPRSKPEDVSSSRPDFARKKPSNKAKDSNKMFDFVPRGVGANRLKTEMLSASSEANDEWSETGDTLTLAEIDQPDEKQDGKSKRSKKDKPKYESKWWQFRKRRTERLARQSARRKKIKRIILILLAILLLFAGFMGFKFLRNFGKIFNGNILDIFNSTKLKGEDQGRVNILLAGNSDDDGPGHGGAELTDSIMLISIDTINNKAFTTSIPRDLYVSYAGEQCSIGNRGKINGAYVCGEELKFKENGYSEGGMGLLSKVVEQDFGIKIHYTAKINYTAFKQAVDAVGGIEIEIKSDDPRGIYDYNQGGLQLSNGRHKLNGDTALRLARARNSDGGYGINGDFGRTNYQQQMLVALKEKALSTGVVANPAKITGLLDAAGNNVETSFEISELRRLYDLSKLIGNENIQSIDLASDEVKLVTTGCPATEAGSIVCPVAGLEDFSEIKAYFKKIMSNDPLSKESAKVVVLNGGGVEGAARSVSTQLESMGLTVGSVGNASQEVQNTTIIDKSSGSKTATKSALEKHFGVTATTSVSNYADSGYYQTDFIVIVGPKTLARQT